MNDLMNFCNQCASPVTLQIPDGDNRARYVCQNCNTIHYVNPRIVAGTLPIHDGKVLLCKRAIEPRLGYWTLPGGFMENNEGAAEAALRETWEEAFANVTITSLLTMISVTHISQVHLFFLADLPEPTFHSGPESLEVALFAPEDIPWTNLAFATVEKTLRLYLDPSVDNAMTHVCNIDQNRLSGWK